MRSVGFFIGLAFSVSAAAQHIQVSGRFLDDSVAVGKPVRFALSVRYSPRQTVLFPDSSYAFAPFEFYKKKYFNTFTKDTVSTDSVIYSLTSFELDSLQTLRLPVFAVNKKDCVAVYSPFDTVRFKKYVSALPDSSLAKLPLKTNTLYYKVAKLFNYFLAAVIAGGLLMAAVVCWFIFRKKILAYFAKRRLAKEHQSFLRQFEKSVSAWNVNRESRDAETALAVWKKYVEKLMAAPISKLTTKEIRAAIPDEHLAKNLSKIDGVIYGQIIPQENPFLELKAFGLDQYYWKMERIKNGK
ncbi:MAG: hypothetical protein CRN43_04415 [Candidatus Nephrothrix sp. EaCA]|nr:MAG: hypothetical protein CRN43_04415 [Candidatus Nephrothrix sp. EaCA]